MYSRRNFLKLTGLIGLIPVAIHAKNKSQDDDQKATDIVFAPERIAIAQGATDATSTLISILAHKNTAPTIQILDSQFQNLPFSMKRIDFNLGSDFVIYQLFIDQLSLDQNYMLTISDALYPDLQIRNFKALDLANTSAKIAIISCSCHREAGPKAVMFQKLFQTQPDAIFFNGDLVYANSSLDTYLSRPAKLSDAYKIYVKSMMEFELYSQKNLTPIFSTWDDHDLAYNNADASTPNKDVYYEIFRGLFPADDRVKGIKQGPGVSFSIEAFGLQTFFFDSRYFKDKKNGKFLGDDQFIWMTEEAAKSQLPKMFIFSQQLMYYSWIAESYQRHALVEFNNFMDFFKQLKLPVLFITGDVHYSQIQEIAETFLGYKTYEITSSALFSSSARNIGKRKESEGQLAYYGYPNFLVMDQIKTDAKNIDVMINCVSEQSDTQFTKNLKITI